MRILLLLIFAAAAYPLSAQADHSYLKATAVVIPGGGGGIGFDDLVFSPKLHKVLVPAGHTGRLYLIDPASFEMTSIGGFSSSAEFQKGHKIGISSADEGQGYIFVVDHGRHRLMVVDPKSTTILDTAELSGEADYVRHVGTNIGDNEIWVTEPHAKQIEVFRIGMGRLKAATVHILVPDDPESLVIDYTRGRAYTNAGPQALAIDIKSHKITQTWPNGCQKSRGDALDEQKGFLFVSCGEGKAEVFDLNHHNKLISQLVTDPGPDVISYNQKRAHLYFTSSKNATLSVIGVSPEGKLSLLAQAQADKRAHCVVGDDQDNIWVCAPLKGQLLRYKDSL